MNKESGDHKNQEDRMKASRVITVATCALFALGSWSQAATNEKEAAPRTEAKAEARADSKDDAKEETKQNKTIWDYKSEIGLSDQQVQSMQEILARFQKNITAAQQKLMAAETQLKSLIDEDAPLDQIRTKLQKI